MLSDYIRGWPPAANSACHSCAATYLPRKIN